MTENKVFVVEVNNDGQFIIPEEIRRKLSITDSVNMDMENDKVILTKPEA